jgi:hypothetical protein
MTLVGGTTRGWVSSNLLRTAGLLDTVRKLFKKTKLKEKNDKRTPSANKASNAKRTAPANKANNDKRTPSANKANNAKRTAPANKANNDKRTPSAKKASDAKRTPAGRNTSYKQRTPEQKEAAKRRLQEQRAEQDEFDGKDREKLLVALRAGMEADAHNWPNAVLQELDLDREYTSSICGDSEMTSCRRYQSKINNASLQKCACAVCWELVFKLGVVHGSADFTFDDPFSEYTGLPLLTKAMHNDLGTITVCKTCMGYLNADDPEERLPPRSTANDLWFVERSELMQAMTLTAKLLICPVRQKAYIVKLKAIGKKETRQRAILGSTIAFPQENVLLEYSKLPHALSELSRSLSVILVGSKYLY